MEYLEESKLRDIVRANNSKTENWMSAKQSADYIGVTDRTLRNLCKIGKIKYTKPSKKLMFRKSWLDRYMLGFGKRITPTERKELEELS
jgi:excisionase family DNA binding protein